MTFLINAYSTLNAPPSLDFKHTLNGHRDLSDPELPEHLSGFAGYVCNAGDGRMNATRYAVMRHVQRVRHHYSLAVEEAALDNFAQWAWRANALSFLPDGTIRDPDGRLLLHPDGQPADAEARVPWPQDATERKSRTDQALQQRGIHVPPHLPPVPGTDESLLRPANEVAQRTMALLITALRAESLNDDRKPILVSELQQRCPLGYAALSPLEQEFLRTDSPPHQDTINFLWRYEALALLQWALGWLDDLPFPTAICGVPEVVQTGLRHNDKTAMQQAQLRPVSEIIDVLDLHFRLHWAVRQARLDEQEAPGGLEAGVIMERHHALNWLVCFENADWDDVDTPT